MLSRQPFDTIQLRKQIATLNNDLVQVKKELKEANQFREKAMKEPIMGAELIDNTLHTITSIQQQKNDLQSQNDALNQRIVLLEQIYSQGFDEKQRYMEGAIWMGNRLNNEIRGLLVAVEYLVEEFMKRWSQQMRRDERSGASSGGNPNSRSYLQADKGGPLSQHQSFVVDHVDMRKLLDWFQRATSQAGEELNSKVQEVVNSAQLLLDDVDQER